MKRIVLALAFVLSASGALAQYAPIVGIPIPPFGISEVAPAPTIYVNEATGNDANPGTVARPRRTIPTQLAAGTVVSVPASTRSDTVRRTRLKRTAPRRSRCSSPAARTPAAAS
jgi:hypothetical protein